MDRENVSIHTSAQVDDSAVIGERTCVWNWVQIREGAKIGADCVISKGVYVDKDVVIGNKVKIQNNVSVFHGVTIEDGVFVGPHVCFTNDLNPRAVTDKFELAQDQDWIESKTLIKKGASIGANCTIVAGVEIGEFALVGAGSVVTHDLPKLSLSYGNPAIVVGQVDESGNITKRFPT